MYRLRHRSSSVGDRAGVGVVDGSQVSGPSPLKSRRQRTVSVVLISIEVARWNFPCPSPRKTHNVPGYPPRQRSQASRLRFVCQEPPGEPVSTTGDGGPGVNWSLPLAQRDGYGGLREPGVIAPATRGPAYRRD